MLTALYFINILFYKQNIPFSKKFFSYTLKKIWKYVNC